MHYNYPSPSDFKLLSQAFALGIREAIRPRPLDPRNASCPREAIRPRPLDPRNASCPREAFAPGIRAKHIRPLRLNSTSQKSQHTALTQSVFQLA